MAELPVNASLTIGFLGSQEVHRENAKALLTDYVNGWKKSHRGAVIRVILSVEPFTDTLNDIADWALTSGYELGLIGHEQHFTKPAVMQLAPQAEGKYLNRLPPSSDLVRSMLATLALFDENRLILVADPNEDDIAYNAVQAAKQRGIVVRSLLHGLERVIKEDEEDTDDEEEAPVSEADLHLVDRDENELEETEPEETEIDGEEEDDEGPDLDALARASDVDGDDAAQAELNSLAQEMGIDPFKYETWTELVVVMRADGAPVADGASVAEEGTEEEEPEPEPEEEPEPEPDIEDEPEEVDGADDGEGYFDAGTVAAEEEEEPAEVEQEHDGEDLAVAEEPGDAEEPEEIEELTMAAAKPTRAQLDKLVAKKDSEALYEIAARYRVYPGRGIKMSMMVDRVMEKIEGKAAKAAPVRKTKKAPAKKKAAAKKAPAKKAPVKKAAPRAAAKKAPAKKIAAVAKAPQRTAAATNGHVDKATLRAFVKAAKASSAATAAAIEVVESLV